MILKSPVTKDVKSKMYWNGGNNEEIVLDEMAGWNH